MNDTFRIGIIGTGAIANLHARAYKNIGWTVRLCTDVIPAAGQAFADRHGTEFVDSADVLCRHPEVDIVDVCTFPDVRLQPLKAAAAAKKHVQVQKPMSTTLETAREMIDVARDAGIVLGVVSQHRFDDCSRFLASALPAGRLGTLLQFDAYVKWYRSDEYYARPIKGSWAVEGGGALINQAIHQIDLLQWLAGPVSEVSAVWQLGAAHKIESEDIVNAVMRYASGATGVVQAATAFWPGYSERVEIHGTTGTAVITGDKLTTWDVRDDAGDPPPLAKEVKSGASDPMAISLEPFERQFRDLGEAITTGRQPLVSAEQGYRALAIVDAIYRSCRTGEKVTLS
jgi:UDP-N-acetyl-2-amino-2-deoxyglucuronate dehydrogenase